MSKGSGGTGAAKNSQGRGPGSGEMEIVPNKPQQPKSQPNPQQQAINSALSALRGATTPAQFNNAINTLNGIYGAGGGGPLVQAAIDQQRQAIASTLATQVTNARTQAQLQGLINDYVALYGVSNMWGLPSNVQMLIDNQIPKIVRLQRAQQAQQAAQAKAQSANNYQANRSKYTASQQKMYDQVYGHGGYDNQDRYSAHAVLKGYDLITTSGSRVILLNRGAISVQK